MSTGGQKRTRSERVAALELPPAHWRRVVVSLGRQDALVRITMAAVAAVALCVVIRGWTPPFSYRTAYVLPRDVVASVGFVDPLATAVAQERAAGRVRYVYSQDPEPLGKLRAALKGALESVVAAESYSELDPGIWADLQPEDEEGPSPTEEAIRARFETLKDELNHSPGIGAVDAAVAKVLAAYEEHGISIRPLQKPGQGNQDEILVHPVGQPERQQRVRLNNVFLRDEPALRSQLEAQISVPLVAEVVSSFLWTRLAPIGSTLTLDAGATEAARERAAAAVANIEVRYEAGQNLAEAGRPLSAEQIRVLRLEHEAVAADRPLGKTIGRAVAVSTVIFALFCVSGLYLYYRQRRLMLSLKGLFLLLALVIGTVALGRWLSADAWRAELVPLLLFGQIVAIAYRQEPAMLLSGVLAVILVLGIGHTLAELAVLMGASATAIAQLGRIRSRSKLIYVGVSAGAVAFAMSILAGILEDQPLDWSMLAAAARVGVWAIAAGFLMSGLLPFVERVFGVLTDISLLELGDVAHPLLQELVRRAPSTYNHSITVGSIAEAAAEAIEARGLLVRVGCYFHDIGKMLKPGYFIENQAPDSNQHASLVPAMSTLVIIAHVKDGTDLARQHHLPEPIIDFIRQHHGTTLVEYFYVRASEQSQADPNGGDVEESTFRYPGPKPQTKEAGVLMLADAVESASRTLVDPTPARIESLVREVAERRLDDGQFDESGLTLRELRTIQNSLVKSLTAIYHGRIKYPEPKTA
jgi:putative nucleotidyltransferase with HDIG domain